jgi:heme exporter protein CcmD
MNHWTFIWTAYGMTLAATFGVLIHSLFAMRIAENRAEKIGERN